MKYLGIDLGSSSVKVSVYDHQQNQSVANAFFPKEEMSILAPQEGWAEQSPEYWWECLLGALTEIKDEVSLSEIQAIGISYQMHGLVAVDNNQSVVRPAIIWCDSRAVEIGHQAFDAIGHEKSLRSMLNSPGNFTASKLAWVKKHEPVLYNRIDKIMLPGDYIAMRLSGEIVTTSGGLSEGILWDFDKSAPSVDVLNHYEIEKDKLPPLVPAIGLQGQVNHSAQEQTGIPKGTPITYRAGDQPNNAMSLNVLDPGELATTAGTSAVIYAVSAENKYDPESRVNTFLHVNDTEQKKRNGILLCVNGSGILYSWLKRTLNVSGDGLDYQQLNSLAQDAPIGAQGLHFLPFGNGAERILRNQNLKAQMLNLDFNVHDHRHMIRAAKEGIVYAMNYGLEIIRGMGVPTNRMRAGASNLFQSSLFRHAFVNSTGVPLELYDTDGAEGAGRAACAGVGHVDLSTAFSSLKQIEVIEPDLNKGAYQDAYASWKESLENATSNFK